MAACLGLAAAGYRFYRNIHSVAVSRRFDCLLFEDVYMQSTAPNCSGAHENIDGSLTPFSTNSLGLFDKEHSPQKAKGWTRVLLMGDSMLIGYHRGPGPVEILQDRLAKHKIEVVNGAGLGYGLNQLRLSQRKLIQAYHPDLVFLYEQFGSSGPRTAYYHLTGYSTDAEGLVDRMGPINFFWPIPMAWTTSFYHSADMRYLSNKLRTWQEAAIFYFGTKHATWFSSARRNAPGMVDVSLSYIRAMEKEANDSHSDFYGHFQDGCLVGFEYAESSFYRAEVGAAHFPGLRNKWLQLCAESISGLHLKNQDHEFHTSAEIFNEQKFFIPGDIHLNAEGTSILVGVLEKDILRAVSKFRAEH